MNELKAGLLKQVPRKPEILQVYEIMESMKIPLVSGGFLDQPYIWLLEWETVRQEIAMMEYLNNQAKPVQQGQ